MGKEHLLVGADQGACAFVVQLRLLGARGHMPIWLTAKSAASPDWHMLVAPWQSAPLF
ncbi:hypothetical protein [Bacillus aerolatus]|uniref:hypothetical protein n=1 Tax=Bacillus aerolatus TaxID=2653354 RepID=UPI00177D6E51|nr:hypothetical protein [Bacillus aerolatus]